MIKQVRLKKELSEMYLRVEDDIFIIDFNYSEISTREIKLLSATLGGEIKENKIEFSYSESNISSMTNTLDERNIQYNYDVNVEMIIMKETEKKNDFKKFSLAALDIKKNNNVTSDYISFLEIIKCSMSRRLYDFQARASYHMAFSLNSCNFSVPGAGKTSIVYGAYSYLKHMKKIDKLLIIGPLSSYAPWKKEFFECFGVNPEIQNLSEMNNIEKKKYLRNHPYLIKEISFINYEGISNIMDDLSFFIANNKVMLILDEAHKIKNPESQRAQKVMGFSQKATSKVILTGTPIPNGYKDLFNLFEFIWPGKNIIGFKLGSLHNLVKLRDYKTQVKKLMDNIDPYYIRIRKEHLNLPAPKFNTPIFVEMGEIQRDIYDFIVCDFISREIATEDMELQSNLKRGKLIRMMQCLTDPSSIGKSLKNNSEIEFLKTEMYEKITKYSQLEVPPKYMIALDLVKEIVSRDSKVIIWCTFTSIVTSLRKVLEKNGIKTEALYGEIDNADREIIIDRFHSDESLSVIIANPAAVAESISLHKVCHNAIYIDKNFNAAHYMQSKDRIHRVGLPKNTEINYYFIISSNSIDEVIHKRVLEKERVMLDVIEGKEVPLFLDDFGEDLSNEDILAIEKYLDGER